LLSHKVLRYLVPLFLIMVLLGSAWLAPQSIFYAVAFAAQIIFYGAAALASTLEWIGLHNRLLALPQYFVLANLASLIAFYQFLRGERYVRWEPMRTSAEERARK